MTASDVLQRPVRSDRVLIVDDRKDNLLALEAVLEPLGLDVLKADSGPQALHCLLEGETAVIVLDVQMPGMDGFETAALLKSRSATRHIPIIFLTAISRDLELQLQGYEVGAIDYICKPFDPDVLRAKVQALVELSSDLRAVVRTNNVENTQDVDFNDQIFAVERIPTANCVEVSGKTPTICSGPSTGVDSVETVRVLDLEVKADPSLLSAMGKSLGDMLSGQPDEVVGTVQLLTNELVTNSIIHASSAAVVRLDIGPSVVRVEVSDASSSVPILRGITSLRTHGRGLHIVRQIANRHGWTLTSAGKTFWFEIDLLSQS